MKHSIGTKLSIWFTSMLIVLVLVLALLFSLLFQNYTMSEHKENLKNRGIAIASSIENFDGNQTAKGMHNQGSGGINMYLRSLSTFEDIWIVDSNLQVYVPGHDNVNQASSKELPFGTQAIIQDALAGEVIVSEAFSELEAKPTISVAVPFTLQDGSSMALLLHEAVDAQDKGIDQGMFLLLMSSLVALLLGVVMAILASKQLSKPIQQLSLATKKLTQEQYDIELVLNRHDELGSLSRDLATLSQELQKASIQRDANDALRQDFITNLSHELKTPVTVLRGSLEAICDGIIQSETQTKQYHEQMLKECIFLEGLILDLLDLSKLQSQEFALDFKEVSIQQVTKDSVASMQHFAQSKNITIDVSIPQDSSVLADYQRIRQLVVILLNNAIKFSSHDQSIDVFIKDEVLYVKDRGCGMSEEQLEHIFEKFYSVRNQQNKEGSGLGLSIAYQIALRHNFSLRASSKEQEGSCFCLDFSKK